MQDTWRDLTIDEVFQAYLDCRKNKSFKDTTVEFELDLFKNINQIYNELKYKTYEIGTSIRFVTLKPKPREVWAANFKDRVVQHIVYNRIAPIIYKKLTPYTCACIPGRGTHYAANMLHSKVRTITNDWKEPAWYLKCDFSNFFGTLDKSVIISQIDAIFKHSDLRWLLHKIILHDPRTNYVNNSTPFKDSKVPKHKSLLYNDDGIGLAIGNITSQIFANLYLSSLDHYLMRELKVSYVRYVDDIVILSKDKNTLKKVLKHIQTQAIPLKITLNARKTLLHRTIRGVNFVGFVSKPYHLEIRKRIYLKALAYYEQNNQTKLKSYYGMLLNGNNFSKRQKLFL